MGKYLRPRRGNENDAIRANVRLLNGEIFMEYPEGKGMGKSPGRLIIGNGDDTYAEKVNNSTIPEDFKPFITDPSLYQPSFNDSSPREDYKYDDEDRGTTIIGRMLNGIRTLPEFIGYIKKVLCEHTDNLKYDDYRIKQLEENGGYFANILDMKVEVVEVSVQGYPTTKQFSGPYINDYDFLYWINVSPGTRDSGPVYIEEIDKQTTFLRAYNAGATLYPITYKCYAMYVRRKSNN